LSGQAKDFKPGPYPKTEAERRAAAEKYNMRPEDYEPMPDDGLGFGDYPKLAKVSADMKSDWEEWDDTYNKRNYGEPVSSICTICTTNVTICCTNNS
jgi:NADH dehydrogenase (ubiquinone) 1 beta subcomplex subunit 8